MDYQSILRLGIFPSCVVFVISLVSIVLTTHYWILGDWVMARWVEVNPQVLNVANMKMIDIIIEYTEPDTNATIVALCLSLAVGVLSFLGWYKLRRADMDMDYNLARRRFYVGAVVIMALGSFGACIAALILHYTQWGDDQVYTGCTSEFRNTQDWILWCTREAAACNVLPDWRADYVLHQPKNPWASSLACGEARTVKWMLIPVMVCHVSIIAIFTIQAWKRRKTRYERIDKTVVEQTKIQ